MTICAQCRHTNDDSRRFCANCGMQLGSEDEAPSPTAGDAAHPRLDGADRQRAEFMRAQEEANRAQEEARRVKAEAEQRARAASDAALRRAAEETRQARDLAFARAEVEIQDAARDVQQRVGAAGGAGGEVTATLAQVRQEAESKAKAEAEMAELQAARRARRAREEAYIRAKTEAAAAEQAAAEAVARAASLVAPAPVQPIQPISAVPTQEVPMAIPAQPVNGANQTSELRLAPTDEAVQAVQPEAPRRRVAPQPVEIVQPDSPPSPTDRVCASCGLVNDASRRFCRRCGTSLLIVRAPPSPTWWQRLFSGRRRRHAPPGVAGASLESPAASAKKKRAAPKISVPKIGKQILAILALGGLGLMLGPYRRQLTSGITRFRAAVAPRPSYIFGEKAYTGTPQAQTPHTELTDGAVCPFGCPPAPAEFASPDVTPNPQPATTAPLFSVELGKDNDLNHPVNLFKVGLDTGIIKVVPPTIPAPHHILLVAYGIDGRMKKAETFSLADKTTFQSFVFKVDGVHRVDVYVIDLYGGAGRTGKYIIDEIEFFERT